MYCLPSCENIDKKFQVLRNMIMTCILLLSGLPKAAVVNQNRLLTALVVLSSNGVTANDVIYVNLPLYHTAGFIIGFIGSIETGKMTWLLCCGMYGFNSKSHSVSDGAIFLPPKVKFCHINGKMVVVAISLLLHYLVLLLHSDISLQLCTRRLLGTGVRLYLINMLNEHY